MNDTVTTVRSVLRERSTELLSRANVVATGVGYKMVDGKLTDTPETLDGYPVNVQIMGTIRVQ